MLSHARKHPPILEEGTFLMDEHFSNVEKAVDYATANGAASIVDETGRTIWVLSMLTEDLAEVPETVFSKDDYRNHVEKVFAHAAATGSATVVDENGQAIIVIAIPTVDLPPLHL